MDVLIIKNELLIKFVEVNMYFKLPKGQIETIISELLQQQLQMLQQQ